MIGFADEASPQTVSNTVRMWCAVKPRLKKNTARLKANMCGFYPVEGSPAIITPERSKAEDFCGFLDAVRQNNGERTVVMILDNCPVHRSKTVAECALSLDIRLVFLPPYSPHLNPIEFIWKTLKRIVSETFLESREHMREILTEAFGREASKDSYCRYWVRDFLIGSYSNKLGS